MRGKLPRSFSFPETDPLFLTDKRYAWLQDAALAVIATVGISKKDLANEIVKGVLLSQSTTDFTVPEFADFGDASNTSGTFRNKTDALTAYALGYYLEVYPSTTEACDIVKCLRLLLHQLETQRNIVTGLIKDGTNYFTADNILAYFAFKQAGLVLNEVNYTNTSVQLSNAIVTLFWKNNSFIKGINNSGADITDLHLSYLSYGAMFWANNHEIAKANLLLSKIENLATIDSVNGAKGYKADSASTQVWFEGSYATAIAYYKVGNSSKYKLICNELNKYIDTTDGGNIGTLLKSDFEDTYIEYKAIGSTAWTLIGNKLKSLAFSTRSGLSAITGCVRPYFNEQHSDSFSKNNCGDNTTTTPVTYTVNAGRYISYVDQPTADDYALNDIATNGQTYANTVGVCVSTIPVGNDLRSKTFYSTGCTSGQNADPYVYSVAANTYTAATKEDANALADADINANGQTAANTANNCTDISIVNYVWANTRIENVYAGQNVYGTIYCSQATNTDINVRVTAFDSNGNGTIQPYEAVNSGQFASEEFFIGSYAEGEFSHLEIININPSEYNGMTYNYD